MIIALNKVDKSNANPDKIREQLSGLNILVEEWGGNVQAQEISAKFGNNVDLLCLFQKRLKTFQFLGNRL